MLNAAAASTQLRGAVLRLIQQPLDALYRVKKNYVGSASRNKKMHKRLNVTISCLLEIKGRIEAGKT